jgi:hypothetical protein
VIKVALVCDSCGAVIAHGVSANEVRFQAQALYRRREYKDLCLPCAGAAPTAHAPSTVSQEAPDPQVLPLNALASFAAI